MKFCSEHILPSAFTNYGEQLRAVSTAVARAMEDALRDAWDADIPSELRAGKKAPSPDIGLTAASKAARARDDDTLEKLRRLCAHESPLVLTEGQRKALGYTATSSALSACRRLEARGDVVLGSMQRDGTSFVTVSIANPGKDVTGAPVQAAESPSGGRKAVPALRTPGSASARQRAAQRLSGHDGFSRQSDAQ